MIFQPRADDLLAVVQILRPDEAHDRVDQQRLELSSHRVRASFERLLIDAVMGVGRQARALPRLEIHDVVAHRAAAERQRGVAGFAEQLTGPCRGSRRRAGARAGSEERQPMTPPRLFRSASVVDTRRFGERVARALRPGDVLLLHGDLGAGKTTFSQGVLTGLRSNAPAQSPTFILVSEHAGTLDDGSPITIRHIDLYRLDAGDVASIGLVDLLNDRHSVALIEWPERAAQALPDRYLLFTFAFAGPGERTIAFSSQPAVDRFDPMFRDDQ